MSKLCFVSVAALIASAGVASAAKVAVDGKSPYWSSNSTVGTTDLPQASTARQGQTVQVPVAGIESRDAFGAPGNIVVNVNVGPNALITGIGWNVTVEALGESWLSEMRVGCTPTGGTTGVFFGVVPTQAPGVGSGTSNGIIKLNTTAVPEFQVGADGLLRMEFFESFDDAAGVVDGIWRSGFITVQFVPTPGAVGLFGLAGLAAARRRRA